MAGARVMGGVGRAFDAEDGLEARAGDRIVQELRTKPPLV